MKNKPGHLRRTTLCRQDHCNAYTHATFCVRVTGPFEIDPTVGVALGRLQPWPPGSGPTNLGLDRLHKGQGYGSCNRKVDLDRAEDSALGIEREGGASGRMHPFHLTFENPDLERAYDRYREHEGLWCRDKWFFKFFGAVIILLSYGWIVQRKAELAPSVLWFGVAWVFVAVLSSVFGLGKGHVCPRWRTPLAVFLRLYVAVGVVVGKHPILWNLHERWVAAIPQVIAACYSPQFMMSSLSVRLKFRLHIIEQAISSCIIILGGSQGFCEHAKTSPGFSHLITMASCIGGHSHGWLNSMNGKYNASPLQPASPCLHLVIFLHVVVSYTMVSYVVWILEKRSRVMFLRLIARHRTWNDRLPVVYGTARSMYFCHGACFLLFTSVSWELLAWAPAFVQTYGAGGGGDRLK